MNKYYVYVYLDTRKSEYKTENLIFEHEPFYVGKGKGKRAWQHLFESQRKQYGKNSLKLGKIERIIKDGYVPKVMFFEEKLTEEAAMDLEKSLIAKIGTKWCIKGLKRGPLTNMTSGGDGYTPCEELRKRMGMPGERNPMFGKTHTSESKEKIRQQSLKLKHTKKTKNKMSKRRQPGGDCFQGKKWILVKPGGERIKIDHLRGFCEKEKLPYGSLYGSFKQNKPIGMYANHNYQGPLRGCQLFLDESN